MSDRLFQIEENKEVKRLFSDEIVVGIDFGTTFSLVAHSDNQSPLVIEDLAGNSLISSEVLFSQDGENHVGSRSFYSKDLISIKSVKRLIGKTFKQALDSDGIPRYVKKIIVEDAGILKLKIYDKLLTPVEIASFIFKNLRSTAENHFQTNINKAVVTVPAYFDAQSKDQIKTAAQMSGLEVLRIISEPTAAGYAYGMHNKKTGSYMVFDFGGGTFDVSIIEIYSGIIRVVSTAGDNNIGGDDIDIEFSKAIKEKYKVNFDDDKDETKILELARKIKENLSSNHEYKINNISFELDEFNFYAKNIVKKAVDIAVNLKNETSSEIEGIILAGGSSRLNLVHEMLKNAFELPIYGSISQDTIVACGAALYAENIIKSRSNILIDVVPLSLGIETFGGATEKIIHRNSPIPTSSTLYFTNSTDNQTGIILNILQGEREMAADCKSIAHIEVPIEPCRAGASKIEVTFSIDENGALTVMAKDVKTEKNQQILIDYKNSLTYEEINSMLMDAFDNSMNDYKSKLLIDSKNKALMLSRNLSFIAKDMSKEHMVDQSKILETIKRIDDCISNSYELDVIKNLIHEIESEYKHMFEFYMQNKLKEFLSVKKIY